MSVLILVLAICTFGCASSHNTALQSNDSFHIEKKGKRYVVKGVLDLDGTTLTLPRNVVFDCREGVIKNGKIVGNGNRILYLNPFLDKGVTITGCYLDDNTLYSKDILVHNHFSNVDIHNVYNLAKSGANIVFEEGTYKRVTQIDITKDITLDFSNSTIETAIDHYELSSSVFMTEVSPAKRLKNVTIKNVVIDGKLPRYGLESGVGPRRNAIRLMDVENVTLENVTIKNFRQGTSGYYDKDVKKRHMAGVCAIFGYTNCTITNSSLSMCTGEGFYLVPIDNNQNYTEFTHNKSIHNYGTFLTLVDGKCLVEDNYLEKFGLSGFNLFCYNSIIRNNHFKDGEKFNCIDITENGLYWPRNVEISGNDAERCDGFIMVSGEKITIKNNKSKSPLSGFALTIYGYSKTTDASSEYLIQRGSCGGAVSVSVENNEFDCKGGIATYNGCKGDLKITRNIISVIPDEEGKAFRGSAIELFDCQSVIIDENTFNDSFRNSITRSNVYITLKGCSGDMVIKNNQFNRTRKTPDQASYFLFTEGTSLDRLTIENNDANVKGITVRAVEGRIPVKGTRKVRANGIIIDKTAALE